MDLKYVLWNIRSYLSIMEMGVVAHFVKTEFTSKQMMFKKVWFIKTLLGGQIVKIDVVYTIYNMIL